MRKLYTLVLCFLFIVLCGFICLFSLVNRCDDRFEIIQSFIYEGNEYDNSFNFLDTSGHLYAINPNYPQNVNVEGVIKNDSIAYNVAAIVVSNVYGSDCMAKESPARIKLINDSIWSISGSLNENNNGGTYSVLIERFSGKILRIAHEK